MREALFLTVWLRRQEAEIRKVGVLASATADLLLKTNTDRTVKAYIAYVDAVFPFSAKTRTDGDKELIATMQKEAAKGPLHISPITSPNPFQDKAKQMRIPDEFRQKLQQKARRRQK